MEQSSRAKTIVLLIILIAVIVAGIFWLTLRRVDPSWLITLPDLYAKEYSADMSRVEMLRVNDIYNDIVLMPSRDEQCHIEYLENSYEHYLFVTDQRSISCDFIPGDHYLKYGLPMRSDDCRLVILLPAAYGGDLDLTTASGDITLTLPGRATDYTVQAESQSGAVSLPPDCDAGSRMVTLTSVSGDISVVFDAE